MPDADKIASQLAELRDAAVPDEGPSLTQTVDALRKAAGVAPLFDVRELRDDPWPTAEDVARVRKATGEGPVIINWAVTDRTLPGLMQEATIRVMQAATLRWQVRCRRLELQVYRLEHELAAAREEADRLRAASEHAREALEWGLNRPVAAQDATTGGA